MAPRMFPCAVCGQPIQHGSGTKPVGEAAHRKCWSVRNGQASAPDQPGKCFVCKSDCSSSKKYCSNKCKRAQGTKYVKNIHCINCGELKPHAAGMKCRTCYTNQWRKDNPDTIADIRRRRRARQANATIEHFTSTQVFDRDNWTCQHCKQPVHTYKDSRYHADRATLDHIKPLAKGGEHSLTNTQCLCHHCNGTKGAKYVPA